MSWVPRWPNQFLDIESSCKNPRRGGVIWRWPARSDNLHAKGVAVNHHQAMMPPLHFSAASPSHQEQQPTKTQLRVAAPPIAPSAEKPTDRGINHDRRITNFPITPSSDHHTHFPQSAIRNPSIPSTNHPSLHNPTRDPKKKGDTPTHASPEPGGLASDGVKGK
jgi:hypothetical protein